MAATFKLTNGKEITKPANLIWIPLIIVVGLFVGSMFFIPVRPERIKVAEFFVLLEQMFTPQSGRTWVEYFSYAPEFFEPMFDTIKMAFGGTIIGSILAVPFAVLSSKNIVKSPWVYQPIRFIMSIIRTIPTLVLAVIATMMVGLGVLSGIIAVTLFTFGIMMKMLFESIETIDMGPYEALQATGGNTFKSLWFAVKPQVTPIYLSYLIYIFEINIRASAILGYVGAGGIGMELNEYMSTYNQYQRDRAGLIILMLLVVVLAIQFLSTYLRRKIQ
jgi:phosphonate transport system permease protein